MPPRAASNDASGPKYDTPLLTLEMKAGSRIHSVANSMLNLKLLVLLSDPTLYARAVSCFYPVFKALEDAIAKAKPAELKHVKALMPVLARTAAIEADLQHYLGYAATKKQHQSHVCTGLAGKTPPPQRSHPQ